MKELPQNVSESTRKRNPHLYPNALTQSAEVYRVLSRAVDSPKPPKRIRQSTKPLLNKTEHRFKEVLVGRGIIGILEQAITLRLDPPFKSYKADLAFTNSDGLNLIEVKGPHRFRKAGIAKAALAAKTYPHFIFHLADWEDGEFKESVLSP